MSDHYFTLTAGTVIEGNSGTRLVPVHIRYNGDHGSPVGTAYLVAFYTTYSTSDGTATLADGDYVHRSAGENHDPDNPYHTDPKLYWPGYVGITQTIYIQVRGDTRIEGNEHFFFTHEGFGDVDAVSVPIIDDDAPGSVSIGDIMVTEGNAGTKSATFTVTRSGGDDPFEIDYATADGSATTADGDYEAASGTLQFGAGVNTQTISVAIRGDNVLEGNEAFVVNLSGGGNAVITDGSASGLIVNDDGAALDFNLDHRSDIFWRSEAGGNGMWLMNGGTIAQRINLQAVDPSWHIQELADFDGDGKSDILWRQVRRRRRLRRRRQERHPVAQRHRRERDVVHGRRDAEGQPLLAVRRPDLAH
jgi:hypothetical protein